MNRYVNSSRPDYVEFHSHDSLSILDGHGHAEGRALRAAELGMPALAVSNHGNLFGAMRHWRACNEAGIKPIIGIEAYLAPTDDHTLREKADWGSVFDHGKMTPQPGWGTHLGLYAMNAQGLRNLYKLHELSYLQGYYFKPRVSKPMLAEYSDGVFCLSGCVGGELATRLRLDQVNEAENTAADFAAIFGENFAIEIMSHGLDFEADLNPKLETLAKHMGLPLFATNDVHYTHAQDDYVHECLLAVSTGTTLKDERRFKFDGTGFHLRSQAEMGGLGFSAQALGASGVIADQVQSYDEVFARRDLMPGGDPKDLQRLAAVGLDNIFGGFPPPEYTDRLEYELSVITRMGYAGYFLCLHDIVTWARKQDIFINGRGSGVASLTFFCLGVTDIDPMEQNLVFERFLNIERKSMPDLDLDFPSSRRDEVYAYAIERFGADKVCRILTLGTIATKRAVQDAAKVLGHDSKEGTRLKAMVPPPKRGRVPELSELPGIGKANAEVYALALGLEGQIRNTGAHAGGLVISPIPLSEIMPVKQDPRDSELVSGFTMGEIEDLGLVKNDLLGLTTLDVILDTLEAVNGSKG